MKMNRKTVNLMVAMTFSVIVISGIMAFFLPFSIITTGSHALMGFVFIFLIALHISNNLKGFKRSFSRKNFIFALCSTIFFTALFIWQPKPVKYVLALSNNMGAALDRFDMKNDGMIYHYSPAENYKLKLEVRAGQSFDPKSPPEFAIWLENKSNYHIKTLHAGSEADQLPYWSWKVKEYEKAKNEADTKNEVDTVSGATPNSSFDPKDYILPERNKEPFYLIIEINQKGDSNEFHKDQPSIIYKVEIDNQFPKVFQIMDIVGYSKFDAENKTWDAYFPDEKLTTALHLIDSALLTIDRE